MCMGNQRRKIWCMQVIVSSVRWGGVGVQWNSQQMAWALGREGQIHYGINRGEDFVEDL